MPEAGQAMPETNILGRMGRYVAGGDWVRWIAGPIFEKELRVASRRRRNFVLRIAYFVLLSTVVLLFWLGETYFGHRSAVFRTSQMAEMGLMIVVCIQWFQFITLPLVGLVMLSGSIGDEIYRRSLGVLMTTPITSFQIVVGKLSSRLLQVVLLMATSLPLLAMVRVFGGVPWDYVVSGLCITLTATLFAASLSMWFSISGRRVYMAVVKTIVALALLYFVMPLLLIFLYEYLEQVKHVAWLQESGYWKTVGQSILYLGNPYVVMVFATEEASSASAGPGSLLPYVGPAWLIHCGIMLGLSAVLVLLCVWRVRRVALAEITGDTPQARRKARRAARSTAAAEADPGRVRRVFGPPMVWKELQTRFTRSRLRVAIVAVFALGVLGLTYAASAQYLNESAIHSMYVVILMLLGLLVTTVVGATGITTEKEAGTWEPLLGTALTAREIVIGKAFGAIGRSLPVWLLLGVHVVLFVGIGYIHPILVVHLAMLAGGVVAMLTGTGLFFSVCFRRTTFAVAMALVLAIFIWGLAPLALLAVEAMTFGGTGSRTFSELVSTVHPLVQAVVVTNAATGDHAREPLAALSYEWPLQFSAPGGHGLGVTATTAIVLGTMLGNMGIGAAFLGLTTYLVRRRR